MKYPIGIQSFDQIIENGYVYVDKTDMIYSLVTLGKTYFLSRPRRFGKSLLLSTIKNYFMGRKNLFKGLYIENLEEDWYEYPVFHIDFNGSDFTEKGSLAKRLEGYVSSWEKEYGVTSRGSDDDLGWRFITVIKEACKQKGRGVVVLVDEYDKPILDVIDIDKSLEEEHRNMLKGFYSVFKAADEYLKFVFLTGVTKFSQVSVFSGFNQPSDISMEKEFETICGITQDELEGYFKESILSMSKSDEYNCSYDEMIHILKKKYDGYHFSKKMTDIYNPFSLLNALRYQNISDYWFSSGTPSYLVRLLNHTDDNINELTGKYYSSDEFIDYKADIERPLPMIYQSGYLTIKDFDREDNTFLLDYPNDEVKSGLISVLAANYLKTEEQPKSWVRYAVSLLKKGKLDEFRDGLSSFLSSVPYSMRRKENERERERYFHYTFYLLMRIISVYTVYTEKQSSHGRVDCIIETPEYVYIFEFKLDGTADDALRQINEKGYATPYKSDSRKIYKVGVSFSSITDTIEEWKNE